MTERRLLERADYVSKSIDHERIAEIADEHAVGSPADVLKLARALYGLERMGDHKALGETYPVAPIYVDLTQALAGNSEARRDIIKMLEVFDEG